MEPKKNVELSCVADNCGGIIDFENPVRLRTGCASFDNAFPCKKCGRLHWYFDAKEAVSGVNNRGGESAYLIDGKVVNR